MGNPFIGGKALPLAAFVCFLSLAFSAYPQTGKTAGEHSFAKRGFRVTGLFPHDPTAYTQGLVHRDGLLYESTGLYGKSSLRKTDPVTGKAVAMKKLPEKFFAEGITVIGPRIYQLTWKSKKGFIYRKDTLAREGSFSYSTEGWGLTDDGKSLIMSDGSEKLYFLSLGDFKVKKTLRVRERDGSPVRRLNELEYARGKIYCNIWGSDDIVVVNPQDGRVERRIDLSGLRKRLSLPDRAEVMNGIAWKPSSGTFFVTGKYWSEIFEVEFLPPGA